MEPSQENSSKHLITFKKKVVPYGFWSSFFTNIAVFMCLLFLLPIITGAPESIKKVYGGYVPASISFIISAWAWAWFEHHYEKPLLANYRVMAALPMLCSLILSNFLSLIMANVF